MRQSDIKVGSVYRGSSPSQPDRRVSDVFTNDRERRVAYSERRRIFGGPSGRWELMDIIPLRVFSAWAASEVKSDQEV